VINQCIDFYNYSRIRVKTKTTPNIQYFSIDQKNRDNVYLTKYILRSNSSNLLVTIVNLFDNDVINIMKNYI